MALSYQTQRERRSFVDSSAYLALLDADDEHHQDADATLRRLVAGRYRQFTTNVLLIESHALILSTLGRDAAARFLLAMQHSATTIVRTRASDETRAQALILRHSDKNYSFADAISFVVMERLGIRWAFTFDHHFAQHGLLICNTDQP
jgi:predicted nucleic acid-binding protein